MKKHQILLSFGANLPSSAGSPADTIRAAIRKLERSGLDVVRVSRFYSTKALTLDGAQDIPDFVNAAALVEGDFTPDGLLALLHAVEAAFGRERQARWSARTLDIDLIAFDNLVLPDVAGWYALAHHDDPAVFTESPMVPHPRAHQRGFVLAPLLDVAPDWVHPVLKQSVRGLCSVLDSGGGFADIAEISAGF